MVMLLCIHASTPKLERIIDGMGEACRNRKVEEKCIRNHFTIHTTTILIGQPHILSLMWS